MFTKSARASRQSGVEALSKTPRHATVPDSWLHLASPAGKYLKRVAATCTRHRERGQDERTFYTTSRRRSCRNLRKGGSYFRPPAECETPYYVKLKQQSNAFSSFVLLSYYPFLSPLRIER